MTLGIVAIIDALVALVIATVVAATGNPTGAALFLFGDGLGVGSVLLAAALQWRAWNRQMDEQRDAALERLRAERQESGLRGGGRSTEDVSR